MRAAGVGPAARGGWAAGVHRGAGARRVGWRWVAAGRRGVLGALLGAGVACLAWTAPLAAQAQEEPPPPRILLDVAPQAVRYQLDRLSNSQLVRVERRDDDPRYRPVYVALLTRPGLAATYREEALAALSKLDGAAPARVLLGLFAEAGGSDEVDDILTSLLVTLPPTALRAERGALEEAATGADSPEGARRAAFAALLVADGDAAPAWEAARGAGRLHDLFAAAQALPADLVTDEVRSGLAERTVILIAGGIPNAAALGAALEALAWARPDAATFRILAAQIVNPAGEGVREAAVRAMLRVPEEAREPGVAAAVARALIEHLAAMPLEARTDPAGADALELAHALVARLEGGEGDDFREALRGLGVRVVRIGTIPERMAFDRKWFVVEAGRPVQIVFENVDAMPHNLVVGFPGSLEVIGQAGSSMQMPDDPSVKPFVPNLPVVLAASGLLNQGESERIGFIAPRMPGSYVFVCTFPGHWVLMYGVMLVLPDLAAWEANPTPPADPRTGEPYAMEDGAP